MTIDSSINTSDTHVVSGSTTGELFCWDLVSGKVTNKYVHTARRVLNSLCVHPRKDVLLTASVNTIKVWGKPEDVEIEEVVEVE